MNGGIARSNMTPRPGSSTRQPMMPSVSGHNFSAEPLSVARPPSPAVITAAAAPSPNKAVATIAAGSSLSSRIEIEQVSTVTNSQLLPGSEAASRAVVARPLTPPAQPRPKTGHAPDVAAQAEPRPDARFEAGRRDPGGRDGDDAVDLVGRQAGSGNRSRGGILEHLFRCREIDRVALGPAVGLFIPFVRGDEVALGDRGIVEHRRQLVEQVLPAKRAAADRLRLLLIDHMRRNRSGERE